MKQSTPQLSELITGSIDNQLTQAEQSTVDSEIAKSESLHFYAQVERATKKTIQSRKSLRISTPESLRLYIQYQLDSIDAERAKSTETPNPVKVSKFQSFSSLFFSKPYRTVASFILVILVGFGVTTIMTPSESIKFNQNNNFYSQSLVNFNLINSGSVSLAFKSNNIDELREYFKTKNLNYTVEMPVIDAEFQGATVCEGSNHKIVTIVYKTKENKLIAMSEMKMEGDNTPIPILDEVRTTVNQGGWYWRKINDNTSFVAWKKNDVFCAVVSDIQVEQLAKLFSWEKV
jgi:hypothetical protein